MLPIWHMNGSVLRFSLHLAGFFARWMGFRVSYNTPSSKKQMINIECNQWQKNRPASTMFGFLARGMDFSLQRNNLTANVANVKYVRFLPFLLHLAAFLATGMGFFAECCTFLFKEIIYSDFHQHGTYKWLFFSVFSFPSCSGIVFIAEWCISLYKEIVRWTHERVSTLFMILYSECPSCCGVVLFPRFSCRPRKWVLVLMGLVWFLSVGFSGKWTVEDAIRKRNEQRV